MKTTICSAFALLAALPLLGASTVTAVSVAETGNPFKVKVNYTLTGDPAIVTFEVRTNGVPVKGICRHAVGDVNHLVQPGDRTIVWANDLDWPGHLIAEPSVKVVVKAWAKDDPPDYAIFDLAKRGFAPMFYESAEDIPGDITDDAYKTDWLVLRRIHAAGKTFQLGALQGDTGYKAVWGAHTVTLSKDFYIGVYPITKRQYELADPRNTIATAVGDPTSPYLTETDVYVATRPAIKVQPKYYVVGSGLEWPATKGEVQDNLLLGCLRAVTGIGTIYLPTRAQWEIAARAGTVSLFANGSNTDLDEMGWYAGNNADDPRWTADLPHAVGLKKPNAWGLYDMHGNVAEYCVDRSGTPETNADGSPVVDPAGPSTGNHLWIGGSYSDTYEKCAAFSYSEVSDWGGGDFNHGFRVVCDVEVLK